MATRLTEFWQDEDGQDLVEYSLLMAFIAMMALSLSTGLETSLASLLVSITQKLSTVAVQTGGS